jgi:hypothetical protein
LNSPTSAADPLFLCEKKKREKKKRRFPAGSMPKKRAGEKKRRFPAEVFAARQVPESCRQGKKKKIITAPCGGNWPCKNFTKNGISLLQSVFHGGIIVEHDCDRYALKREVAAEMPVISAEYVRF